MQQRILTGRFTLSLFVFFVLLLTQSSAVHAQGFIATSTFLGSSGSEQQSQFAVDNGFTYIVGQVYRSTGVHDFPITIGTAGSDQWHLSVTKLDANGTILWSRMLGGNSTEYCSRIRVFGGSVWLVGHTLSSNFPVTDGSTFLAPGNNGFLTRLDANNGNIQFSGFTGRGSVYGIDIVNGYVYIAGDDASDSGKGGDVLLAKYDAATNARIYKRTYGGTDYEGYQNQLYGQNFQIVGNTVYMAFITASFDFPVTDGSAMPWKSAIMYAKMDATSGNLSFATYIRGDSFGDVSDLRVDNNGVYIFGKTMASNLPVTDGSSFGSVIDLSADGGDVNDAYLLKFDATSNRLLYAKYIGGNANEEAISMEVQNDMVFLLMTSNSTAGFPVTAGSAFAQGGDDIAFAKLNATTGDLQYASFITASASAEGATQMRVVNGEMYILAYSYSNNYPVTNGSVNPVLGRSIAVFTKIGTANNICFSSYLGDAQDETPTGIVVNGNDVYITGITFSASFPVTNSVTKAAGTDYFVTRFNLDPTFAPPADVLSPASQTVCKNGVAATIGGPLVTVPSSSMPLLYRSGVPFTQSALETRYQWQVASSAGGPWTDIVGAIDRNYSPQAGTTDQYYRRRATASACASGTIISTSSVAAVLVNGNFAPVVNAGGVINTCSSVPVTLGGAPTATVAQRGTSITSYTWTPATATFTPSATVANPGVSPLTTTIYTVTVTDNNGCTQVGQALVNAYAANAGPDVSTCNGKPVRIGGAPIAGLPGVVYAWASVAGDPVTRLSCTNCAQPDVNNLTQVTTYRLTLTVPVTGGGTCTTTDDVIVTPATGPTSSFGAPDVVICAGGSGQLGRPAEAGFTYTWSPGNYLAANNTSQTVFQPGLYEQFSPNPFTYYLTAVKGGCYFVDTVLAYMLKADAGPDACGPVKIGNPSMVVVPGATYTWTKITNGAGTSNFMGAPNGPTVNVSSCTVPTTFRLSVTLNGVTCTDDVVVSGCGCIIPRINVKAANDCASYMLNNGQVSLTASAPVASTFVWSTTGGVTLSAYSGAMVYVTNSAAGTVTVTAVNAIDPSSSCSNTIDVNNPAWSLPAFKALDTTVCPNAPVFIGQSPVAGYTYAWSGLTSSLSPNASASNPGAVVNSTTRFPVVVTDVGSGCTFRDTAIVRVIGFPPGIAGRPVNFCGVSTSVQLGLPALPNTTYTWTPATTYAPSNTAANPTVTVAATTTFYVTAVNSATGCSVTDSVRITVNPAVPPFSFADQSFCPAVFGAMPLPAGPAGMTSYLWTPSSQVVSPTSNGPTATTLHSRPQNTMVYNLKVTNASGCTGSADVRFVPSIPVANAGPNRTICRSATTQLGAAAEAGATYSWTGTAAAQLSATNVADPVFTPIANGTFTFTVTKTQGGCSITGQVVVTVIDFSLPLLSSPTVCESTCVQVGPTPQSGVQYYWSPTTGLSNPFIANPVACISNANRLYTLTAVGVNGCVSKRDIIVGVNPTPAPSVVIPPINTCLGGSIDLFQPMVSPAGNYNYLWSPNNGTLSDIYIATPAVATNKLGTSNYTLNVSDPVTGCATNAVAQINTLYCNVLDLPVRLKATAAGTAVNLQWQVPSQPGIAYYGLEHSTDGVHFTPLQKVWMHVDGNYAWLHKNPATGNNFYRIRYTDVHGKYGYSGIEKVSFSSQQDVSVYPNPARQYFNLSVSYELAGQPAELILLAADGRTVWQKKINSLNRIQQVTLAGIGAGKYFVRLVTASGIILKELTVLQ